MGFVTMAGSDELQGCFTPAARCSRHRKHAVAFHGPDYQSFTDTTLIDQHLIGAEETHQFLDYRQTRHDAFTQPASCGLAAMSASPAAKVSSTVS